MNQKYMRVNAVALDERCKAEYAKFGDAAFDLRANIREAIVVAPGAQVIVPTGLKLEVQLGYVGMVTPRSGLAAKHGVTVTNSPGLIDAGYRGEIQVILLNTGRESFRIEPFDRIAQFAIVPVYTARFYFVDTLEISERGEMGLGSSGVK